MWRSTVLLYLWFLTTKYAEIMGINYNVVNELHFAFFKEYNEFNLNKKEICKSYASDLGVEEQIKLIPVHLS